MRRLFVTLTFVLCAVVTQKALLHRLVVGVLDDAASSTSASRCALGAPPSSSRTRSSSFHAHPSTGAVISLPSSFRSIDAGSISRVPSGRSMPWTDGGQPRHTTRTGYIRSAGKPSAHSSRVAATSAYTSPLVPPNFTFTSSPSARRQANFGVAPPSFLYDVVAPGTSALRSNSPGPSGPTSRFFDATSVALHTWALAMTCTRSSRVRCVAAGTATAAEVRMTVRIGADNSHVLESVQFGVLLVKAVP